MTTESVQLGVMALALVAIVLLVTGCETTREKSARMAKSADQLQTQSRGVVVTRRNRQVKVVKSQVLSDPNGTAAVVWLENRSKRPVASAPLALTLKSNAGKVVYRNDTPGLEPALNSIAALAGGQRAAWVDDQIQPSGKPKIAVAKIGPGSVKIKTIPKIVVKKFELENDPDGISVTGSVANQSKVDQRKLVLFGVVKRGKRLVAAGTAQVERLRAGREAGFQMFFIGNPAGGKLSIFVPPTVVR